MKPGEQDFLLDADTSVSGYWLNDVGVHTPEGPCCSRCGAGEYEPCDCPSADELEYLIWWRAAVARGEICLHIFAGENIELEGTA